MTRLTEFQYLSLWLVTGMPNSELFRKSFSQHIFNWVCMMQHVIGIGQSGLILIIKIYSSDRDTQYNVHIRLKVYISFGISLSSS